MAVVGTNRAFTDVVDYHVDVVDGAHPPDQGIFMNLTPTTCINCSVWVLLLSCGRFRGEAPRSDPVEQDCDYYYNTGTTILHMPISTLTNKPLRDNARILE